MTRSKPLVGVTAALEHADEGGWLGPYALVPANYVSAVERAGGIPLLLPPQSFDDASVTAVLGAVDALVLTGGVDVDPALYGADPDPHTDPARPERDAWERALVLAALDAGTPVLAICRGLQLLNVALGGTLHQHLPVITDRSHGTEPSVFVPTPVTTVPGTRLAAVVGDGPLEVRCHHHQAVDRLAGPLVTAARSVDGVVEGVELPGHPFALAVQWHPEEDRADARLLAALVAAAS